MEKNPLESLGAEIILNNRKKIQLITEIFDDGKTPHLEIIEIMSAAFAFVLCQEDNVIIQLAANSFTEKFNACLTTYKKAAIRINEKNKQKGFT